MCLTGGDSRLVYKLSYPVLALRCAQVSLMDLLQDLLPLSWGMMIASPYMISPSSTWYGHNAFGISLISSGHPTMIMCARALSSGSSWIASWWSHFFSASMYMWLTEIYLGESLVYPEVSISIRCLLLLFPLLGNTWLWNHNPEVRVTSSVDVLGHLSDSSWRSAHSNQADKGSYKAFRPQRATTIIQWLSSCQFAACNWDHH